MQKRIYLLHMIATLPMRVQDEARIRDEWAGMERDEVLKNFSQFLFQKQKRLSEKCLSFKVWLVSTVVGPDGKRLEGKSWEIEAQKEFLYPRVY